MLVFPPTMSGYPITATLVYNYMRYDGVKVLWIGFSEASIRVAESYHRSALIDAPHVRICYVNNATEWRNGDNALLFAEAKSIQEALPCLRYYCEAVIVR